MRPKRPSPPKQTRSFTGVLYQFSTVRKTSVTDDIIDWPIPNKQISGLRYWYDYMTYEKKWKTLVVSWFYDGNLRLPVTAPQSLDKAALALIL